MDLILIAGGIVFFGVTVGFLMLCDKLGGAS